MKSSTVVTALGALAQETRLGIFRELVKRGPEGYTPSDLMKKIDIPAPTLSFHLKELQRADLLNSRREGRFLYYSANFDTMHGLVDFLTEKCCRLADSECDSSCTPPSCAPSAKKRA